jgi:hypothetical protein
MKIYPYSTGTIVMNDNIFVSFGGLTGTTTPFMREAAYMIAEVQVVDYFGTLLMQDRITGTFPYVPGASYVQTDYGYVSSVDHVRVLNPFGQELYVISGTSRYTTIEDDTYGYIMVRDYLHGCGCCSGDNKPHTIEVVYTAGFPTGVCSRPQFLMAMTMASQITLNEMIFPNSNETSGDAGVLSFSSLQYSETRKMWHNTAFGSSARSRKIAQLLDSCGIPKARSALVLK